MPKYGIRALAGVAAVGLFFGVWYFVRNYPIPKDKPFDY